MQYMCDVFWATVCRNCRTMSAVCAWGNIQQKKEKVIIMTQMKEYNMALMNSETKEITFILSEKPEREHQEKSLTETEVYPFLISLCNTELTRCSSIRLYEHTTSRVCTVAISHTGSSTKPMQRRWIRGRFQQLEAWKHKLKTLLHHVRLITWFAWQGTPQADPGTASETCGCRSQGGRGRPGHSLGWSSTLGSEVVLYVHLKDENTVNKVLVW